MEFVWTVSLGQLISTVVIACVVIAMYGAAQSRVTRYTTRIGSLELEIGRLKADLEALKNAVARGGGHG